MTLWFACAVPASHVAEPDDAVPADRRPARSMEVLSIAVSTVVARRAVRAVGHRRHGGAHAVRRTNRPALRLGSRRRRGRLPLVVPLLERTNVSSAVLAGGRGRRRRGQCASAATPAGARTAPRCRGRRPRRRGGRQRGLPASAALQIIYPKNRQLWLTNSLNDVTRWNSHSYVLVQRPGEEPVVPVGTGPRRRTVPQPHRVARDRRRGRNADHRMERRPGGARLGQLRRHRRCRTTIRTAATSRSSASAADATSSRRSGAAAGRSSAST